MGLYSDSTAALANGNYELGLQQLTAAPEALPVIRPPEVNFDPEPVEPGDEPYTSVLNYEEQPGGGWVVTGRNPGDSGLTTIWQTPIDTSGNWELAKELAWRYLIKLWT